MENSRKSAQVPDSIELKPVQEEEPKELTPMQKIVFVFMVTASMVLSYFVLNQLASRNYNAYIISDQSLSEQIIPQFSKFMAILLIVQVGMAEWMEMISYKVKNDIYRCHRNIISHHILWGLIFFGLLVYKLD